MKRVPAIVSVSIAPTSGDFKGVFQHPITRLEVGQFPGNLLGDKRTLNLIFVFEKSYDTPWFHVDKMLTVVYMVKRMIGRLLDRTTTVR